MPYHTGMKKKKKKKKGGKKRSEWLVREYKKRGGTYRVEKKRGKK